MTLLLGVIIHEFYGLSRVSCVQNDYFITPIQYPVWHILCSMAVWHILCSMAVWHILCSMAVWHILCSMAVWHIYNERARARCIYHAIALWAWAWVHEHYTLGGRSGLGQNSLVRFNLLTPGPLFLRLRIYYRPQILN